MIASTNPFTGQTVQVFEPHSPDEVERRLELALRTFECHRKTSFSTRAAKLVCAAGILEADKRRLAVLMTEDGRMGLSEPVQAQARLGGHVRPGHNHAGRLGGQFGLGKGFGQSGAVVASSNDTDRESAPRQAGQ